MVNSSPKVCIEIVMMRLVVQGQKPWFSVRLIVMILSYSLRRLSKVLVTEKRVTPRVVMSMMTMEHTVQWCACVFGACEIYR
jgi:hypothetical protein